ncbi:MAG TPA: hypothetical protein VH541_05980 [Gaiellaceae bacterium]
MTVWQVAPHCRFLGSYVLRADRGANLLRLPHRIGKHRLRLGSYHFVAASHGTTVLDVHFRVFREKKRLRVQRHGLGDACLASALFPKSIQAFGLPVLGAGPPPTRPATPSNEAPTPSIEKIAPFLPPALRALNPANGSPLARAVFFALLACAIALLATGSLPERIAPAGAAGLFVTRHRGTITIGGFALFVAAVLLMRLF